MSEENKKPFKPLIQTAKKPEEKKSTLKEKTVTIKDTMNFGRTASSPPATSSSEPRGFEPVIRNAPAPEYSGNMSYRVAESHRPIPLIIKTDTISEEERTRLAKRREEQIAHRKKTMRTQKMSLDVNLKLEIIEPFLRSADNIPADKKLTINDKIEILIEAFLESKLTTRQMEGFHAIYENYLAD